MGYEEEKANAVRVCEHLLYSFIQDAAAARGRTVEKDTVKVGIDLVSQLFTGVVVNAQQAQRPRQGAGGGGIVPGKEDGFILPATCWSVRGASCFADPSRLPGFVKCSK